MKRHLLLSAACCVLFGLSAEAQEGRYVVLFGLCILQHLIQTRSIWGMTRDTRICVFADNPEIVSGDKVK